MPILFQSPVDSLNCSDELFLNDSFIPFKSGLTIYVVIVVNIVIITAIISIITALLNMVLFNILEIFLNPIH